MKKEFVISIMVFICFMVAFIFSVKITETQNNIYIRQNYIQAAEMRENNKLAIDAPSEKALEYQQKKVNIWLSGIVLSMLVPALFLFTRLSVVLRNWAQSKSRFAIIVLILYFSVYYLINAIISLPLDYYSGFVLKHAYGLSNQSIVKWVQDLLKGLILTIAAGSVFICIPYILIKRSPKYWWLHMGILLIPVIFFVTLITPVYIDPIFNKYQNLQDKKLEEKIYQLVDKTYMKDVKLFQVNKSEDTKEMNAYMTGVLNTKRIVLWDTTVKNLTEGETLSVVAHEMGHYLMGHVWKAIIFGGIVSIFIFYLVNKSALWILDKSGGIFGFNKLQDIAAVPLIILLLTVYTFAASPFINYYARYTEREADRFELELTRDNEASMSSMIKLHEKSLILPRPGLVYELWNYDHPTFEERVNFADKYRPWEKNESIKYGKYIK
ncbi:M48 family metallopeptidase [Clostridium sp. A1-XYC3]|uniref:M48 family metallopeptidase n=1 Tax=Clostridium tanneri TaxID=3037988 RepID=A0ABU4JTG7_9CLOT|nr:M48 family metallopeptidase [Clostridium sp. A1-XYC3]MDW8801402.1 M48 family metallopeptidase [Clostridium sp. A1-XYC3]